MQDRLNRLLLIVCGGVMVMTLLIGLQSRLTGSPNLDARSSDGSAELLATTFPGLVDLSPAQLERWGQAQRVIHERQRIGIVP